MSDLTPLVTKIAEAIGIGQGAPGIAMPISARLVRDVLVAHIEARIAEVLPDPRSYGRDQLILVEELRALLADLGAADV